MTNKKKYHPSAFSEAEKETMLCQEFDLLNKVKSDFCEFEFVEGLFQWKQNMDTGLQLFQTMSINYRKSKDRKKLLKAIHKEARFVFHALIQIPYIVSEHIGISLKKYRPLKASNLEKLRDKFESKDTVAILLRFRHQIVHELLIDELVYSDDQYNVDVRLPNSVIEYLKGNNPKNRTLFKDFSPRLDNAFSGRGGGFIFLLMEYRKLFKDFSKTAT